jgi:hypothetical protein
LHVLVFVAVLASMHPPLILAPPLVGRLAYALVAVPLPIFFAGLIFSTTFRLAQNTAVSRI